MEIKPEIEELLQHHGIKGMHWGSRKGARDGTRRYNSYNKGMKLVDRHKLKKMTNASDRVKYLEAKDKKWLEKVNSDKKLQQVAKRSTKEMAKVNKQLKEEHGGAGLKGNAKRAMNGKLNAAYMKEMKAQYEEVLANSTYAVYKTSPSRTREVEIKSLPDGTLKANVVERSNPKLAKQQAGIVKAANKNAKREAKREEKLTHADQTESESNINDMFFIITLDVDGFPDEVIDPFELTTDTNIAHSLDDALEHSGVRGMRWGVRHDNRSTSSSSSTSTGTKPDNTTPDVVSNNSGKGGKLKQQLNSLKRERDWGKVLKELDHLTTKEINIVANRVGLENDLKSLSKSKIAKSKDKQDYLNRGNMSDQELKRKVNRLRAKEGLYKKVKDASKAQREFGQKAVNIASSIGVKYAVNKSVTSKDIFDAISNPKTPSDLAKQELIKKVAKKNPQAADALNNAMKKSKPKDK